MRFSRDGTARCWGLGESGQRGDGTFTTFSSRRTSGRGERPQRRDVDLTAGYGHACALLADAHDAVLGIETSTASSAIRRTTTRYSAVPVAVSGITGAIAITTGAYHTCALLADRTVQVLGTERPGAARRRDPHEFVHPRAGERHQRCRRRQRRGRSHVCGADGRHGALLGRERVRAARRRDERRLRSTPVQVVGITGAVGVSAGWRHTCAILGDGTVRCWGENEFGQLGDGTTTSRTTPVPVSGITGAAGVTAGWWHHSCALLGDGSVRCWGVNEWGQLGNGTTTSSSTAGRR